MISSAVQKPRIKPCANGWACVGLGKEGNGRTPRAAFLDWLNEAALYPYC